MRSFSPLVVVKPDGALELIACIQQQHLNPGFIHEEDPSPACQWPSKVSVGPLTSSVMTPNCSQVKTLTIPQVKKQDVAVLGWRGYTWSAIVRPVG
ncbi:hypothetical protein AAFF_G00311070 [Aldrovandia affinis]|uniref:Uncharacterized protein n=1 Tax=Aldrovandia affinis TaxID=143900 RepID=A0AAD7R810_9TELE|nr:hypothetical protein AAFF_G00311070 [Aldrovandia affinis]